MRWFFPVILFSTLTVWASDLEADLKAGEALLGRLPAFAEGPLKTNYWELSGSAPNKLEGYSVTSLSVANAEDVLSLEYEVHSGFRAGQAQMTVDSKTVMDLKFHLKSATFHNTTRMEPDAEVESSDEEMTLQDGLVKARRGKNGEWKEFDVGQEPCFWIVGELIQWVDLKDVNAFAFRELNPVGRWVLPKVVTAEGQNKPPVFPRATEKTYSAETWRYQVTRNADGSIHVEGTRPGDSQCVRKFDYDSNRKLISCVTILMLPKDTPKVSPVTQEIKAVSRERVGELKKLLQQPPPNDGRASGQRVPPPL